MPNGQDAQSIPLTGEEVKKLVHILNASRDLAAASADSYTLNNLSFTYMFNEAEGCIEVALQGDSLDIAQDAKQFFANIIITRTGGVLSCDFEKDEESGVFIKNIVVESHEYFKSFDDVCAYCLPEIVLPALDPNHSRVKQMAVLDDYHQGKSSNHYDSFIFSDENLFYEKIWMLAAGPDIELLCYIVSAGGASHVQAIKFQKKNDECSFVVMDSLAPTAGLPSDIIAQGINYQFEKLKLHPPKLIVNLEGRQGQTSDCWVFALNDGKRMGRQSDLYYILKEYYLGPKSDEYHETYNIPPEYYTMTQSLEVDTENLQGVNIYNKNHLKYGDKKVHHRIDKQTGSVIAETYLENVERHTKISRTRSLQNKKTEDRAGKYRKLQRAKTFVAERDDAKLIKKYNGALITPARLRDISDRQKQVQEQGIPLADPAKLRLDDILGDKNLELILDAAKNILAENNKEQSLELNPINSELSDLKKQFGLDVTYGQLVEALDKNMKGRGLEYEGGALSLLKDAISKVGEKNPERWQNLVNAQRSKPPQGQGV
jgi:hypothetical protein